MLGESTWLNELLAAAAHSDLPQTGAVTERYAEELVAAIRADREGR